MSAFQRLYSLAKQESTSLLWGTLFLLIASGLNLTYPMLIGKLIDSVKDGGGQEAVNQYAIWMIGIFILVGVSTFFRSYLFTVAGERIVTRLQERLFQQVLSQEIGFFDHRRTGELLNRLTSDATVLQKVRPKKCGHPHQNKDADHPNCVLIHRLLAATVFNRVDQLAYEHRIGQIESRCDQ
jgi:ABC-type multidrug transport system fused ATPase/permease subunit